MTNQEIIKEIKDLLSKLEQETENNKTDDGMEKFKVFKPRENENYFFINVDGIILENTNLSDNDFNKGILKRSQVFKIKEHAEEYRSFMDMLKEKSIPFKAEVPNFFIYYSHLEKRLYYSDLCYGQNKDLYFDEEVAKQLIKDYPNEIKHWYLEVPYED